MYMYTALSMRDCYPHAVSITLEACLRALSVLTVQTKNSLLRLKQMENTRIHAHKHTLYMY